MQLHFLFSACKEKGMSHNLAEMFFNVKWNGRTCLGCKVISRQHNRCHRNECRSSPTKRTKSKHVKSTKKLTRTQVMTFTQTLHWNSCLKLNWNSGLTVARKSLQASQSLLCHKRKILLQFGCVVVVFGFFSEPEKHTRTEAERQEQHQRHQQNIWEKTNNPNFLFNRDCWLLKEMCFAVLQSKQQRLRQQ